MSIGIQLFSLYTRNSEQIDIMNPKIWLSSPHMGGSEQKFINEAFSSNWVAPLGPNVNGFEADLNTYLNRRHNVAALSSGTAALHLALLLLGVGPGDEVICQSMTFSASANPIAYVGASPVFVGSEANTWNMSPEHLEAAIKDRMVKGKKPKAIIPVHLYGMPANMPAIMEIAQRYEIPVLEDAAEALGSYIEGKKCGTFGEMACLSFNGNKIITTSGGGALIAQNVEHIRKAVFLATQARDEAPHYQHSYIGYNYRMSNIVAGIGRGQMEVLDQWVALRRQNAEKYQAYFDRYPFVQMQPAPDGYFSNRWLTAVTIDPASGFNREGLRLALLEDNIESRPLWKPMHLQPIFEGCAYYGAHLEEKLFEEGLCLPSGSNLTAEEFDRIFTGIGQYFEGK